MRPALKGLKGVNSVAFTSGDPVALAKVFAKWAGENAEFQFKLGIVDGKLLNVEEVKALATMPGKEEIFCQAALPHQCSGAASGHGHQRHGPRPGGGDQPGRGEGKVCTAPHSGAELLSSRFQSLELAAGSEELSS